MCINKLIPININYSGQLFTMFPIPFDNSYSTENKFITKLF